ncbi:MAG: patatin-like phospholipase family protein [Pseudomonadota bacterium]
MARKLGLALSSGAARGWAHVGVLRGLDEIGLKPDVIVGCSVGSIVGGAYLAGILDDVCVWARELSPLSAFSQFAFAMRHGGLISAERAFAAFKEADRDIRSLDIPFAALATDLATGDPVPIMHGSLLDAVRASSAIPIVFNAMRHDARWLVDGALADPMPVGVARSLGAEVVVGVDLTGVPRTLERFERGRAGLPTVVDRKDETSLTGLAAPLAKLVDDTREYVDRQIAVARARSRAQPQLIETAIAAADIFQMQLTAARARYEPPDLHLKPDMREASPTAFDRADEFIEEGRRAILGQETRLRDLLQRAEGRTDAIA